MEIIKNIMKTTDYIRSYLKVTQSKFSDGLSSRPTVISTLCAMMKLSEFHLFQLNF